MCPGVDYVAGLHAIDTITLKISQAKDGGGLKAQTHHRETSGFNFWTKFDSCGTLRKMYVLYDDQCL